MAIANEHEEIHKPMSLFEVFKFIAKELVVRALGDYREYHGASLDGSHISAWGDMRVVLAHKDEARTSHIVPENVARGIYSDLVWRPYLTPQNKNLKTEIKKAIALFDAYHAELEKIKTPDRSPGLEDRKTALALALG